MNLRNVKIKIKNEAHCRSVYMRLLLLGGIEISHNFLECWAHECLFIGINSVGNIEWARTDAHTFPEYKLITLDDLYDEPVKREKIELNEYVCDLGTIRFLNSDKKRISFEYLAEPELCSIISPERVYKLPNGRTIYAWKDTLEYCGEDD